MPTGNTPEDLALAFVDRLVPGRFDEARRMLDPSCTYAFGGEVLRGEAIVRAFEASHEEALTKLDRIEYLPGRITSVETGGEGALVVVGVSDLLALGGETHTYSDRLAVMVDARRTTPVLRVEHRPIPEERAALAAFLADAQRREATLVQPS